MNNISFIGRLTRDPELKSLSTGTTICNFTVAVDREYKDSNGNKVTDFIPCLAWSPTGELVSKYFHKGDLIGCVGRFESRAYTDNSGNKKTAYTINVNRIDFIQGKSNDNSTNNNTAPAAPQKKIQPSESTSEIADDYIENNISIDDLEPPFEIPD